MNNSINQISTDVLNNNGLVNNDQFTLNKIKNLNSQKAQLKKVGEEFETMFLTKMIQTLDKTVDREGGMLGEESRYVNTFKDHVFQEVGRQIATNKYTSVGIASQIYKQMERFVGQ
ncbi:MAG: hypothetical protein ACI37S_02885 [Candidatus Gastranaerophilaceae bacterium]